MQPLSGQSRDAHQTRERLPMPRMRQESSGADSSRVRLRDAEGRGNGRIRHVSQERLNLGCEHFLSEPSRLGVHWMAARNPKWKFRLSGVPKRGWHEGTAPWRFGCPTYQRSTCAAGASCVNFSSTEIAMKTIPKQVVKIAEQLKQGHNVRRIAVRSVLKWFRASRRGSNIVPEIRTVLAGLGLTTEPQLNQTGLDTLVRFHLSAPAEPQSAAPQSPGHDLASPPSPGQPAPTPQTPVPTATESDGTALESEDVLEPEVDDEPSPARPDERPVTSQPHDWTISVLRDKYDRGFLTLQPKYQRAYVWHLKPELPSRLIESLLLEIPIPPLYFGL